MASLAAGTSASRERLWYITMRVLRTVACANIRGLLAFWESVFGAAETSMMHPIDVTSRKSIAAALAVALALTAAAGIAPAQEGNADEGQEVYKKCRACHDVGPQAKNKVGPLLNDILGRKAGTIEGFDYSPANKESGAKGLVWTEDIMFKYLENPLAFMPGTKMAFAGLKDAQDRKDVIAYLKKFSK
jgi:cytochrome c